MTDQTLPDFTTFERIVQFTPGYNYLHETGPKRRGQHGMEIRFVLLGPEGASQFLMYTGWTPLGEVDEDKTFENGYHREPVHCDTWREFEPPADAPDPLGFLGNMLDGHKFGSVSPPNGADLGYHWATNPTGGPDDEWSSPRECDLLPGGTCYYDGSGLAAQGVLADFIVEGDKAVWRWLEKRYLWTLRPDMEDAEVESLIGNQAEESSK